MVKLSVLDESGSLRASVSLRGVFDSLRASVSLRGVFHSLRASVSLRGVFHSLGVINCYSFTASSDDDETKGTTKGSTIETKDTTKVTKVTSVSPVVSPKDTAPPTCIDNLPPEVLLHVFGYLDPYDLCQAAQTCKGWSRLSLEPQLWTHILPIQWAQGGWSHITAYIMSTRWVVSYCLYNEHKVGGLSLFI